jgi:hypothetical protein
VPEYKLLRVVAVIYTHPHPLADYGGFVLELDFDVVTALVGGHSWLLNTQDTSWQALMTTGGIYPRFALQPHSFI